jgi:hypothetical protein
MYCPTCSSAAAEGAKFCKTCGLNLTIVTQALSGGVIASDPMRDREYKRARKSISDGIQGMAVGAALLLAAAGAYVMLPKERLAYVLSLAAALAGLVTFFRSLGHIVDAKIGPKLLDPALQNRGTGPLASGLAGATAAISGSQSRRLGSEVARSSVLQPDQPRTAAADKSGVRPPYSPGPPGLNPPPRVGTGRVNREQSSPLRRTDREDDLLSKLRN